MLWLLIGSLLGLGIGRQALGNRAGDLPGMLMEMLGEYPYYGEFSSTGFVRALFRLVIVLAIGGNVFWFLRRASRVTELAYQSFVVLLWVGLLSVCPIPRAAQESAGIIELVNTRSAYSLIGDAFASIIRNQVGYLVFGCIASATIVARIVALAVEGRTQKES